MPAVMFVEKTSKICTVIFQKMHMAAENVLWKCKKYTVDYVILCFAVVNIAGYSKKLQISCYMFAILIGKSL